MKLCGNAIIVSPPRETEVQRLGHRDIGTQGLHFTCVCVMSRKWAGNVEVFRWEVSKFLTNQIALGWSGGKCYIFRAGNVDPFSQSYHVDWVQPQIALARCSLLAFFTLEEQRLDIDGVNSCNFLAVSSPKACFLWWLAR